ncbi:MAG: hypothetical protein ACREIJ_03420, partial [Nitrospiraceae bacterium]
MKFRIYLRRYGKLITLYKLHRTKKGLYVFRSVGKDYVSYHEDGRYWIRFLGEKTTKKIREPLSSFTGIESLFTSCHTFLAPMPDDLDETEVLIKAEDIVLEMEGDVCIEIILSGSKVELPELPERLNRTIYIKENWKPLVIIEAFQAVGNIFPQYRYP